MPKLSLPLAVALAALLTPLVALHAEPALPLSLSQLTWFNRAGREIGRIGPLADYANIELSPDGQTAAAAVNDRAVQTHDIWMYASEGGARTRFTTEAADENWLVWSADGRRVVFNSFAPAALDLLEGPNAGTTGRHVLLSDQDGKWPVSWSPDGRFILYVVNSEETGNDIWVLPLTGNRRPYPFQNSRASENWAAFSPDGHWVVFSSTETGTSEVYASRFSGAGEKIRISADGGSQARWRSNGEIVYLAPHGELMAATLRTLGDDLEMDTVEPLFAITYPYDAYHAFDITPDGQRLLVNRLVISPDAPTLSASAVPRHSLRPGSSSARLGKPC